MKREKTMIIPPSIVIVPKDRHMDVKEKLDELFGCKGCVLRMTIYSKGEEETVYVEFKPVPPSQTNAALVKTLLSDKLAFGSYVLRPQLLL